MNKSLNYRKDNRTVKQFKQDISRRTKQERILIKLYIKHLRLNHTITLIDNGIDNTGKLVVTRTTCEPDYKIIIDDIEHLYEIKHSPVIHKWTFKVYQLKQYVKYKANILLYWNTGFKLEQLEKAYWGIIKCNNIQNMLDTYIVYNEPKFGNKPCIQIQQVDFDKWLTIKKVVL